MDDCDIAMEWARRYQRGLCVDEVAANSKNKKRANETHTDDTGDCKNTHRVDASDEERPPSKRLKSRK